MFEAVNATALSTGRKAWTYSIPWQYSLESTSDSLAFPEQRMASSPDTASQDSPLHAPPLSHLIVIRVHSDNRFLVSRLNCETCFSSHCWIKRLSRGLAFKNESLIQRVSSRESLPEGLFQRVASWDSHGKRTQLDQSCSRRDATRLCLDNV